MSKLFLMDQHNPYVNDIVYKVHEISDRFSDYPHLS